MLIVKADNEIEIVDYKNKNEKYLGKYEEFLISIIRTERFNSSVSGTRYRHHRKIIASHTW